LNHALILRTFGGTDNSEAWKKSLIGEKWSKPITKRLNRANETSAVSLIDKDRSIFASELVSPLYLRSHQLGKHNEAKLQGFYRSYGGNIGGRGPR
jgi:hypothetical protein